MNILLKIKYLAKFIYFFGSSILGIFIFGYEKYFNKQSNCDKICLAILNSGTVMVKLAQWISCTEKNIPALLRSSLNRLQSTVPKPQSRPKVSTDLIEFVYPEIIGSGSIASVYKCKLKDKDGEYVIKILDENRLELLKNNIENIKCLVNILKYFINLDSLCFDVESILNQMLEQCDLNKEYENGLKMKELFKNCPFVIIPNVVDSGSNWIIQEYVQGYNYETIRKDYPELIGDYATKIFCVFINMVYDFRFLHADLHDGNTMYQINTHKPENSKIILLDFGFCIDYTDSLVDALEKLQAGVILEDVETISKYTPIFFEKNTLSINTIRQFWTDQLINGLTPERFVPENIPKVLLKLCNQNGVVFNKYVFYWILNHQMLMKNVYYIDEFGEKMKFSIVPAGIRLLQNETWNVTSRFVSEKSPIFTAYEKRKKRLFAYY